MAALAVVASHFTGGFNSRFVDAPQAFYDFQVGAFGVQLFFVISGFVILLSAERAKRPSDFVISRVSRLYPAYWISLIVTVALAFAFSLDHFRLQWWEILANFSMVQRWFLVPNVNDAYWTLAVEMQFYVMVLVVLWLTRCRLTDSTVARLGGAWLVASLAVSVIAHPFASGVNPQLVDLPVRMLLNATLAEYGPLFTFGMLVFISRRNGRVHPLAPVAAVVAVVNAWLLHSVGYAVTVAVILLVFTIVAARKRTAVLLWAPVLWFGKISYSLYIVHTVPGDIIISALLPYMGRDWSMLVAFAVVTLMAWGLYELGERLLSRRFKLALERLRSRRDDRRKASVDVRTSA